MNLRCDKTRESVRVAVLAARMGTKVVWVHPAGAPPPEWVRDALVAAGVEIRPAVVAASTLRHGDT